jgi:Pol polyprotein, beta-barrel domain/Integrase core domain/GAG-pre-integrase domain
MTPHFHLLENYKKFPRARKVRAADKGTFEALGIGTLVMPAKIRGRDIKIMLRDTLYTPDIAFTLISIGKCDDAGYQTVFAQQQCTIKDASGKVLLVAPKFHGLYRLDREPTCLSASPCLPMEEIHRRLAHISTKSINHLLDHQMISGLQVDKAHNTYSCDACIKSKITRQSLPKEPKDRTGKLGDRVYSDVWGPARHQTIDKKLYYISFIDDHSRESVIYLMRTKDEAFEKYKLYEALMLRQRDVRIKVLFTDRGGEYTSTEFEQYLSKQGTMHKMTVHDTPESNGVAERLNRTLVERTRAMLLESNLPKFLWGYALLHANYMKNRTHT